MTLKAVFVGINRYRDPAIFDLQGARLDAVALEALFSDSVAELHAALVTDELATAETVRGLLDETLARAAPDDQIVLSFAGHGSETHHLVFHDSDPGDAATMLAMSDLAELFRRSPAKSILGIIDCCFSGEAPARVLSDGPRTRGPLNPFAEMFFGEGRMLLAAASPNEPAWEHSGKGHGLLTKALIDVLTGNDAPMDIGAATDEIVRIVRAEARRIGQIQTPVFVNFSKGGMQLPRLRRGPKFAAAFPDRSTVRVGANIHDLIGVGLPQPVVEAWAARFGSGLNDLQMSAVGEKGALQGNNLVVVAPTGAGKTFIGEMAAIRAVADDRRAVFLLPYRALVNEKFEEFRDLYAEALQLRVIRCTGDYQDETGAFIRGKYDLALLTYEMFLGLCAGRRTALHHLGVVVVDETQFITDPHRGIVVELLLTLLVTARERGISPQIVALSAVLGDLNGFHQWLNAGLLRTDTRPVPLVEGVIDRSGTFQYLDTDGIERTEAFLPVRSIQVRRDEPKAQDLIVPLVKKLVAENETVIVFRNRRGAAEGCAGYLARELGLPPAAEVEALSRLDPSSTTTLLRECMAHGVACHNSNLTREERSLVERSFRRPDGGVRVMAATTTLAAGINTPASTVILAEQEFVGEDGRPFTVAEYKNMAGRAGRPGYGRPGRSMIYATSPQQRLALMRRFVQGQPEAVMSSFELEHIETWILRLLHQVREVERDEVVRLLVNTFAGYAATLKSAGWRDAVEPRVRTTTAEMLELELLGDDRGMVRLTPLGRACAQSALGFRSALRLVWMLRDRKSPPSARDLMVVLQALPELDAIYTPVNPKIRAEKGRARELAQIVGDSIVISLMARAPDTKAQLQRCKRCLVLLDWISGVPTGRIEERYSAPFGGKVSHGNIRAFADATRFHLRAAADIAQALHPLADSSEDDVGVLLRSLEVGVPADAHDLLRLPLTFARGELLALRDAGISSRSQLWSTPPERPTEILGPERYETVNKLRPREPD